MPASGGRMALPFGMMQSPFRTSSPCSRMLAPFCSSLKTLAVVGVFSVSSTFTTVSAPLGMGAPVMIRIASPLPTVFVGNFPAGTSSMTLSTVGVVMACACLISS